MAARGRITFAPAFASSCSVFLGPGLTASFEASTSAKRRRANWVVPAHASQPPLTVKASQSSTSRRKTASDSSWRSLNSQLASEAKKHGVDAAMALWSDMLHTGRVYAQNFNQMVSILVAEKRFNDAFAVAMEAGERKVANIITFRPLMKHCCSIGDGKTAKKVWLAMSSLGIEGDMFVYAELMGALVRSQDLATARKVLRALDDGGVKPHVVLYNTLLKGYAKNADVRKAFETLDSLEASGVNADETTFNTLLNTCVRAKDATNLEKAIARMRKAGIRPGVPTFNTLLKLYARSDDFSDALEIYRQMQETLEPSIVTFNTLIDGCAHRGDMERAGEFFDEMVTRGHEPDICTMTSLLKGFGRANEPTRAVELFEAMKEGGFDIEDRTRYAVINACLRSGDRHNARRLVRRMMEGKEFVCRPRTYVWLLESDIKANDEDAVCDTLELMLDNDVRLDDVAKSGILKSLQGMTGRALNLADQLTLVERK